MSLEEIIKTVGPVVGLVGGALAIIRWTQDLLERRRKQGGEKDYEEFVANVVKGLGGVPNRAVTISNEQHRWAARAVSEKRVMWGPDGKTLMLPAWRGDE